MLNDYSKAGIKDFGVKDNRELMRNREREVCRVCGSLEVHTQTYNKPTMDCIHFLQRELRIARNPAL